MERQDRLRPHDTAAGIIVGLLFQHLIATVLMFAHATDTQILHIVAENWPAAAALILAAHAASAIWVYRKCGR